MPRTARAVRTTPARDPIVGLFRRGWSLPLLESARLNAAVCRVAFRGAGLRSGILRALAEHSATPEQLVDRLDLDPAMIDGLRAWLDLGVTFGELEERDGRYGPARRSLRRLLRPGNDPVAAYYEELTFLYLPLIAGAPERMRAGERLPLDALDPELVARTSRISEPWIATALDLVVPTDGPVRLLEVGCGSGAHIRTAAELNPALTGVGVELQESAAAAARGNVETWGLADRVQIETGDILDRTGRGEHDLVTLHQNIYYFPADRQEALLAHLRTFLTPGGTLLVTSAVRGGGQAVAGLDLWGAMSMGTERLPRPDGLPETLRAAGYSDARAVPLGRDGMYRAFVGTNGGERSAAGP